MANRLHKVIFSYINYLEFTFSVIMWRPLYQTDGTVVQKCFQFRPSLVAVCFVGLFTGRSVGYNIVADRVVYNCDSILLFEEYHLGKRDCLCSLFSLTEAESFILHFVTVQKFDN